MRLSPAIGLHTFQRALTGRVVSFYRKAAQGLKGYAAYLAYKKPSRHTKTIIFEAALPLHWRFVRDVVKKILKDDKVNVIVGAGEYVDDETLRKDIIGDIGADSFDRCVVSRNALRHMNCDVFVSPHSGLNPFPKTGVRVQTFHTLASMHTVMKIEYFTGFDVFFLPGPHARRVFEKYFIEKFAAEDKRKYRAFDAGYPLLDLLPPPAMPGKNKPVILYSPTWGESSSLQYMGKRLIERILKEDVHLIVNLHPNSLYVNNARLSGGVDWKRELSKFEKEDNFHFAPGKISLEYFTIADVMVSDASGAAIEFLASTLKPVVLVETPVQKTRNKEHGFDSEGLEMELRSVCPSCRDEEEVIGEIRAYIENPSMGAVERKMFSGKILYNKGAATETYLKLLYQLAGVS